MYATEQGTEQSPERPPERPPERTTGSNRALLPHEIEAQQRRFQDRRVQAWPVRLASIVVGILWLTQLSWALPWNNFVVPGEQINGVVPNTQLTTKQPGPYVDNGAGLYHWMTQQAIYGNWLVPSYGNVIKNVVLPNWKLFGWVSSFVEGVIALSLILGIFTRVGGLLCFLQGLNLYLSLAKAPGVWEWSFLLLFLFGLVFLFTGPGRFLGIDQLLRPVFRSQMAFTNSRAARFFYTLT